MTDTRLDEILPERHSKHGEFLENSRATWGMMRVLQGERNWDLLPDGHRHAAYMILHKLARMIAGDPNEQDHWDDIAGYATCVADRIRQPVETYSGGDFYTALARGWGTTRPAAKLRYLQMAHGILSERRTRSEAQEQMKRDLLAGTDYRVGDYVWFRAERLNVRLTEQIDNTTWRGVTDAGTEWTMRLAAMGPARMTESGDGLGASSLGLAPGTPEDGGQHGATAAEAASEEPPAGSGQPDTDRPEYSFSTIGQPERLVPRRAPHSDVTYADGFPGDDGSQSYT